MEAKSESMEDDIRIKKDLKKEALKQVSTMFSTCKPQFLFGGIAEILKIQCFQKHLRYLICSKEGLRNLPSVVPGLLGLGDRSWLPHA